MPTTRLKPEPLELAQPEPLDTGVAHLVLVPELLPRPLWGKGLSERMPPEQWTALCNEVLAQSGERCSACSADGRLLCCERWTYDDENSVAILDGFRVLCEGCENVLHMGRAVRLGHGAQALERLCRVNRIDPYHALALFGEAVNLWRRRSQRDWRIAVASHLLRQYPALLALVSDRPASAHDIN
jgi:hypothetical protein